MKKIKNIKLIIVIVILILFIVSIIYSKQGRKIPSFNKDKDSKEISYSDDSYNDMKESEMQEEYNEIYLGDEDELEDDSGLDADTYNEETDDSEEYENIQEKSTDTGDDYNTEEMNTVNGINFETLALQFVTNTLTSENSSLISDELKAKYTNELSKIEPYTKLNGVVDFDNYLGNYNNHTLEIMMEDATDYIFEFTIMDNKLNTCKLVEKE